MITIHDPIHGSIEVSRAEMKLIDARPLQRLRNVKQLGFADMAFPGATHSRYAHSLGAMQMATRMIDRVLTTVPVNVQAQAPLLRQAVRLATLFHDVGHPPLSHVSERVMPKLSALNLGAAITGPDDPERQATHEDFSLLLLLRSELAQMVTDLMGDIGMDAALIASLVAGRHMPLVRDPTASTASLLTVGGYDLLPLLHSIISSELDADRMDYLRRDAYFCGVSYGQYDHVWLCNHLTAIDQEGTLRLGLLHKAVWGFEDFLLARYHMFLAVYYHHATVGFDELLGRWYQEAGYELPADLNAYLATDDVTLHTALRASLSPWSQAIVRRTPYRLLVETHAFGQPDADPQVIERLNAENVRFFRTESRAALSRYYPHGGTDTGLLVLEPERGRVQPMSRYSPLYARFTERSHISRIYCDPKDHERGKKCVRGLGAQP